MSSSASPWSFRARGSRPRAARPSTSASVSFTTLFCSFPQFILCALFRFLLLYSSTDEVSRASAAGLMSAAASMFQFGRRDPTSAQEPSRTAQASASTSVIQQPLSRPAVYSYDINSNMDNSLYNSPGSSNMFPTPTLAPGQLLRDTWMYSHTLHVVDSNFGSFHSSNQGSNPDFMRLYSPPPSPPPAPQEGATQTPTARTRQQTVDAERRHGHAESSSFFLQGGSSSSSSSGGVRTVPVADSAASGTGVAVSSAPDDRYGSGTSAATAFILRAEEDGNPVECASRSGAEADVAGGCAGRRSADAAQACGDAEAVDESDSDLVEKLIEQMQDGALHSRPQSDSESESPIASLEAAPAERQNGQEEHDSGIDAEHLSARDEEPPRSRGEELDQALLSQSETSLKNKGVNYKYKSGSSSEPTSPRRKPSRGEQVHQDDLRHDFEAYLALRHAQMETQTAGPQGHFPGESSFLKRTLKMGNFLNSDAKPAPARKISTCSTASTSKRTSVMSSSSTCTSTGVAGTPAAPGEVSTPDHAATPEYKYSRGGEAAINVPKLHLPPQLQLVDDMHASNAASRAVPRRSAREQERLRNSIDSPEDVEFPGSLLRLRETPPAGVSTAPPGAPNHVVPRDADRPRAKSYGSYYNTMAPSHGSSSCCFPFMVSILSGGSSGRCKGGWWWQRKGSCTSTPGTRSLEMTPDLTPRMFEATSSEEQEVRN